MRICDLPESALKVGLRIKGLKTGRGGTLLEIDPTDDFACMAWWDAIPGDGGHWSGCWYGNDCECEVETDSNGQPVYVDVTSSPWKEKLPEPPATGWPTLRFAK